MKLEVKDTVTLDDNNEYVISNIETIDNKEYFVLVDIKNLSNIKYMCLDNNSFLEIEDEELIKKIALSVANNTNVDKLMQEVNNYKNTDN